MISGDTKLNIGVGTIFFIGLVLFYFFLNGIGSTSGMHTGVVTAVEYNSNIIWDANLVYFKTNTESSQEDVYCVNDPNVKSQLQQDANSKKIVTIYYKNNFLFWKWDCNGGSTIIYNVKGE